MPLLVGSVMLYSVNDIASMIDAHPSTVRKYLREGDFEGRKIAGKWYVAAGDLMPWLAQEGYGTQLITEEEDAPPPDSSLDLLRQEAKRLRDRVEELREYHDV